MSHQRKSNKKKSNKSQNKLDYQFDDFFDIFDTDQDGIITKEEAFKLVILLGYEATISDIESIISSSKKTEDKNKIDKIDLFNGIKEKFPVNDEVSDETKENFQLYDINGDGKISFKEYKYCATILNPNYTEEEIVEDFNKKDVDGNGYIDYKEFINAAKKLKK